jgi:hypothetical protein
MADGTRQRISEIEVGDEVLATDPETGETGPREVIATLPHTDRLLTLRTSSGEIVTTEDHKYWNATVGEWQESQDLEEGDRLLTPDGDEVLVEGLDWSTFHTDDAYDLDVPEPDSFYVGAGDEAVLVHNCPDGEEGVPYGRGGQRPPQATSYRATDGGMSPSRETALDRATQEAANHQSGFLREECSPTACHVHVDVYNNRGEVLETIHFPYPKRD